MLVTFDRWLQIYIIAHSTKQPVGKMINIREQNLDLKYSEYVKGQLHLNFTTGLYDIAVKGAPSRTIQQYKNAYSFIGGDKRYEQDALKVLAYFYEDLSNFLLKNADRVYCNIEVDAPFTISELTTNFKEVKKEVMTILKSVYNPKELAEDIIHNNKELWESIEVVDTTYKLIEKSKYSSILDVCEITESQLGFMLKNIDNFTLASICKVYAVTPENIKILKLEGYDECQI